MTVALRRRALAVLLLVALALSPVSAVRSAYAGEPSAGGGSSTISQVNKAFGLLFMAMKLVELLGTVDLPPQDVAPPPIWGSHPGPLPGQAPPVTVPLDDAPPLVAPAGA